jgi:hypothetical protein
MDWLKFPSILYYAVVHRLIVLAIRAAENYFTILHYYLLVISLLLYIYVILGFRVLYTPSSLLLSLSEKQITFLYFQFSQC